MHLLLKKQLQDTLGEHTDLDNLSNPWAEFVQRVDETYTQNGVAPDNLIRTQKNLAQERNLLASILNHTAALVILLDADSYILRFNSACENASGYQSEDVIGQTFCDVFVLPDQRDVMLNVFKRMRKDRANMSFKSQWMTRHKRIRLIEWSNAVLVNDDNDVEYIIMTGHDFTDQKRGEIEREHLLNDLHHRSLQLETAAAVSKSIVTFLDPQELLQHTVNLIKESFNFYYVGLFLVDEHDEYAVLTAGTGEAGERMLTAGHRLQIGGDSMIGQCVANITARIALDVGLEAKRFDNPHLPDTRSELALPLIHRGKCGGALTVQSTQESAFTEEDITVLQTMVDQVAIALENARLFEEARHEIEERKETQRALEENRNFLDLVINTLPTHFHVKDLEGRIILLNNWSLKSFGKPFEELEGKTDFDLLLPEVADKFRQDELYVIETGQSIANKEELNITLDGNERWFLSTKAPLRDVSGKIIGTVGASQEITLQKEAQQALEENRNLLSTIIDTLPTFFHVKDLDGCFVRQNKWSLQRFYPGYSIDEVLGKTDLDFYRDDSAEEYRQDELEIIQTGRAILNKEEYNVNLAGDEGWFLTSKAPLYDANGMIIGTVCACQEITAQKQAEAALREAHTHLEERVKERTIQLEAANRELEAFSYSVSHDLRAPLRAINGFSQALVEDYGDQLDDMAQDYINRVRRASQRMGQLIDDLLTLSRVTRRDLDITQVNLSHIAQDIANDLQELEPERNAEFSISPDLYVQGDERLLRVVLENLLNNAWKFTGQRDVTQIEFGYADASDDFFVRDNGVGFNMAYQDKLFRAFQRLHTPTEFEGTGIGLATVQRVMLRHGGRIWAKGEVDKGAIFYFNI